jgi:hypothetical protein
LYGGSRKPVCRDGGKSNTALHHEEEVRICVSPETPGRREKEREMEGGRKGGREGKKKETDSKKAREKSNII